MPSVMHRIILPLLLLVALPLQAALAVYAPSTAQGMKLGSRFTLPCVMKVLPASPAESAGFSEGDVILAIGDMSTVKLTPRDVRYLLDFNPGSRVIVTILRAGQTYRLHLVREAVDPNWRTPDQEPTPHAEPEPAPSPEPRTIHSSQRPASQWRALGTKR